MPTSPEDTTQLAKGYVWPKGATSVRRTFSHPQSHLYHKGAVAGNEDGCWSVESNNLCSKCPLILSRSCQPEERRDTMKYKQILNFRIND